jgi:hypothetical protein
MLPLNQTQSITTFIFVKDLWSCCFGQTPAINHTILVTMEAGKTSLYYPDRIRITGKLSIGEQREQGTLTSIYRIEASEVRVY